MTTLHRFVLLLFAALLAAGLGGCATTRITSAWQDPDLANVAFRKVLVVFQTADPGLRRALEDEMAADIPDATPSYRILSDAQIRDIPRAKEKVAQLGFDSAVVMRVAAVEREQTYVPGRVYVVPGRYHQFWGYWNYGWGSVYEPGYLRNDRIVTVATNVYGVALDKLVWATQSETFNPRTLREAIAEVVKVNAKAARDALPSRR